MTIIIFSLEIEGTRLEVLVPLSCSKLRERLIISWGRRPTLVRTLIARGFICLAASGLLPLVQLRPDSFLELGISTFESAQQIISLIVVSVPSKLCTCTQEP